MKLNRPNQLRDVLAPARETFERLPIDTGFLAFDDHLGRRCEVFAARAFPAAGSTAPIVVHCPGGGQTIKPRDLQYLASHGFAAVSFDWQIGAAPKDRASRWPGGVGSQKSTFDDMNSCVLPLAVQAAGVAIDWMQNDGRTSAMDVGITGISWGGYLTWVINACEPRIKAAVPVYGCGGIFAPGMQYMMQWKLPPHIQQQWNEQWDPSSLVDRQIAPVCFLSSTNDFFGWYTLANQMLDRLPESRRRSANPNNNHHLDKTDAATGVAFLKHHLAGGDPLPPEPILNADLSVDSGSAPGGDVTDTTLWWTPSRCIDPNRCWVPGLPADRSRIQQAFARVRYASGMTLNSPLRQFDRRAADDASTPGAGSSRSAQARAMTDDWPDALAGLAISPSLSTTQYWGQPCAITRDTQDPRIARLRIEPQQGSDDAPFGFTFLGLSDPAWNDGSVQGLTFDLQFNGEPPAAMQVVLRRLDEQGNAAAADIPVQRISDGRFRLAVRLSDFPEAPAELRWSDVRVVMVVGRSPSLQACIGPIRRLCS